MLAAFLRCDRINVRIGSNGCRRELGLGDQCALRSGLEPFGPHVLLPPVSDCNALEMGVSCQVANALCFVITTAAQETFSR